MGTPLGPKYIWTLGMTFQTPNHVHSQQTQLRALALTGAALEAMDPRVGAALEAMDPRVGAALEAMDPRVGAALEAMDPRVGAPFGARLEEGLAAKEPRAGPLGPVSDLRFTVLMRVKA